MMGKPMSTNTYAQFSEKATNLFDIDGPAHLCEELLQIAWNECARDTLTDERVFEAMLKAVESMRRSHRADNAGERS